MPVDQISAGIEMQEDFDGRVTPLFPDQNLPAKICGLLVFFAVLRAQIIGQVDPGTDDFAAAGALHGDLQ